MNTKTNKFIKIVLGFGFAALLLVGGIVSAQTSSSTPSRSPGIFDVRPRSDVTLLAPLPCLPGSPNCVNGVVTRINFADYLNLLFKLAIGLSGVFAVFMIVVGGFKYLSTDAISGKEEGKEMIWRALEGLIMVLASYFILYTINPQYVEFRSDIIKPICDPSDPNVDLRVACLQRTNSYADLAVHLGEIARLANEEIQNLDRQAADLRRQAEAAYAAGNETRGRELEAQATAIEIQSYTQWGTTRANQHRETILFDIRNTNNREILNANSETLSFLDRRFNMLRDSYQTTINALTERGDLAGADRFRDAYQLDYFTIFSEIYLQQERVNYDPGLIAASRDYARRTITRIQEAAERAATSVTDPATGTRIREESAARIQALRTLRGIN